MWQKHGYQGNFSDMSCATANGSLSVEISW
uniref:Uncharacterized protein n=1 Tax=Rhizophora mucronata TaxID=61149 RepID=A0A2P2JPM7_RHIMU